MTTTNVRTAGRKPVRALAVAVVLLLAAGGMAVASHSEAPTKIAVGRSVPDPTTSTSEAPTSTSADPTTTAAPPTSSAPTTPRPATTGAPRPAAPRTTAAPKPPPPPPPPPSGFTAAFYYGWYPSSFSNPGTKYHPSAGQYSSNDPATVKRQIDQMRYAGMQAAIASWWGPASSPGLPYGYQTVDTAFGVGLQAAHGTPFTWSIYFESGSPAFGDRATAAMRP